MKITYMGKIINLTGYNKALHDISIYPIKDFQKICVYICGNTIYTHCVSWNGYLEFEGILVGYYEKQVSRARLSFDIRSAFVREEEREKAFEEMEKYDAFQKSESGDFNGFDFPALFHQDHKKENAVWSGVSDDCADAVTPYGKFHVGSDGVKVYLMTEKPTKTVSFNRSVYLV